MADIDVPPWLKSLPLAPEFHPTEAEFADPVAYISKIEAEARSYGICKIVPPLPKVPKKTVIANMNRSLLQSLDAVSAATHGAASNVGRSMAGSMECNSSEFGRSMGGTMAAGPGRSMSGSSQQKNRGTLSNDVGIGGEVKAKFNTRRQQLGWSAKRSRGQLHSLAQKLVWQSGESYTLEQFEAKAKQFARMRLKTSKELSPLAIETLFWKAAADKPITVEYGNDIPGSAFGEPVQSKPITCPPSRCGKKRKRASLRSDEPSVEPEQSRKPVNCNEGPSLDNINENVGLQRETEKFPQQETVGTPGIPRGVLRSKSASSRVETEGLGLRQKISTGDAGIEKEGGPGWKLANSPWNMRVVARSPGSLLRFMPDEVPGVTSPMVYIGMLFSWFAWHVEDHELHSLNYLHTGAPKTWYAVPGDVAPALEEVVRVFGYGNQLDPKAAFALLGEKTTVMSPEVLIAAGVPCCRLVQNAGEFIVTFPRAYHLGFSHGFNCGEAANFATPAWLEVAQEAATRRAAMNYLPMLSHQQLLYLLASSLPARIPLALPHEPRSSRLKDKKRSIGEDIVKTVFVNDVAQNNRLLGLLLDTGVTRCLLFRDDEEMLSFDADSSEQIKREGVPLSEECLKVSNVCAENVSATSGQVCTVQGDNVAAVKSNDVFLAGVGNCTESQTECLVSSFCLKWGTLSCAACGLLCFSSMAIVQPGSKSVGRSYHLYHRNDGGEAPLSMSNSAGIQKKCTSDSVSDIVPNLTCFSSSSLSHMEFDTESVLWQDGEADGMQMPEKLHVREEENPSSPSLKALVTDQVFEHGVQSEEESPIEDVTTKSCCDKSGHESSIEHSACWMANSEAFADYTEKHFPVNITALQKDYTEDPEFVDSSVEREAAGFSISAIPEEVVERQGANGSFEPHLLSDPVKDPDLFCETASEVGRAACPLVPPTKKNGSIAVHPESDTGSAPVVQSTFQSLNGDETPGIVLQSYECAVDKSCDKKEAGSTASVAMVNGSFSVLELLAATYQGCSDSEEDNEGSTTEEVEVVDLHLCPDSSMSFIFADDIGCTVDAPWQIDNDEWTEGGSVHADSLDHFCTFHPRVTLLPKGMDKFICKEVLLQQGDGSYEVQKCVSKLDTCNGIAETIELKPQMKQMGVNHADTIELEPTITSSTGSILLPPGSAKSVLLDSSSLLLKPTISEVSLDASCSEPLYPDTPDEQQVQTSTILGSSPVDGKMQVVSENANILEGDVAIVHIQEKLKLEIEGSSIGCEMNVLSLRSQSDDHGMESSGLAMEHSAEISDGPNQADRVPSHIEAGTLIEDKGRDCEASCQALMTEVTEQSYRNLHMRDKQLEVPKCEAVGLNMACAVKASISESQEVPVSTDFFHENLQELLKPLPVKSVSRPRFLCLEHALEAYHRLKPLGGSYMMIVCHSDLANIEQRAKDMAEELGLEHVWRYIPFTKANQEEQNFINMAVNIEEEGQYSFKDWVVQLGLSVRHSSKSTETFWSDHSRSIYRELLGSNMRHDVMLPCETHLQPSHLKSVRVSHATGKISKQKKISVAGRWCGRVWMNNQVHPVLGGCSSAHMPLPPFFPLVSPFQISMVGSTDSSKARGQPRKHAVQQGEDIYSERNAEASFGEACVDRSLQREEHCGKSWMDAEEGAGETDLGMLGVGIHPDTQGTLILGKNGKKRKAVENTPNVAEPDMSSHLMLETLNAKKKRGLQSNTVGEIAPNNPCVSESKGTSSCTCFWSNASVYQGSEDGGKCFHCLMALTGKHCSSSEIPTGNNGLSKNTINNSSDSDVDMWQDVTVGCDSIFPLNAPQEIISMDGTVRVNGNSLKGLENEPCPSQGVNINGVQERIHFHKNLRRRSCAVFDGQWLCQVQEPVGQDHGPKVESVESNFAESTRPDALPDTLELGAGAEGKRKGDQPERSDFPSKRAKEQNRTSEEKPNCISDHRIAKGIANSFEDGHKIMDPDGINFGLTSNEPRKPDACVCTNLDQYCGQSFNTREQLDSCCNNSSGHTCMPEFGNDDYVLAPPPVERFCGNTMEDRTENLTDGDTDSSSGSAQWRLMNCMHEPSLTACNAKLTGKSRSKRKKQLGWKKGLKVMPDPSLEVAEGSDATMIQELQENKLDSTDSQLPHTRFSMEGPSIRLRTRSATKLTKVEDGEMANDGSESLTVPIAKKTQKQPQKKTKRVIMKDTEDESGAYPCDIEGCVMSFSTKQELNTHKRNTCTFTGCGKRFGSHKYLLQHRRVHMDERPLKCRWKGCQMTFKWKWACTEHYRVHTGERPYACPVPGCGHTFRFVSDFSRHKRKTGHTKE